jgi:hypothetical protein
MFFDVLSIFLNSMQVLRKTLWGSSPGGLSKLAGSSIIQDIRVGQGKIKTILR